MRGRSIRLRRHSGPHPSILLQSRKEHRCEGVKCETEDPKGKGVVPQETSGYGELEKQPQGNEVSFISCLKLRKSQSGRQ